MYDHDVWSEIWKNNHWRLKQKISDDCVRCSINGPVLFWNCCKRAMVRKNCFLHKHQFLSLQNFCILFLELTNVCSVDHFMSSGWCCFSTDSLICYTGCMCRVVLVNDSRTVSPLIFVPFISQFSRGKQKHISEGHECWYYSLLLTVRTYPSLSHQKQYVSFIYTCTKLSEHWRLFLVVSFARLSWSHSAYESTLNSCIVSYRIYF